MAESPDEFMTVAEVAAILKLNQQTVRNWIDKGSLPAVRIGRRVRIKRSDFDRVLEESYSGRRPAPPAFGRATFRPPRASRRSAADVPETRSGLVLERAKLARRAD